MARIDEFGMNRSQRIATMRAAYKIAELRDELIKARELATKVETEFEEEGPLENVLDERIYILDKLLSTSRYSRPFFQANRFEVAIAKLRRDPLALLGSLSMVFGIVALIASIFEHYDMLKAAVDYLFSLSAKAESIASNRSEQAVFDKETIKFYLLFTVVVLSQVSSFCMLMWSSNTKAQSFATDYLKFSLGIYVGAFGKMLA